MTPQQIAHEKRVEDALRVAREGLVKANRTVKILADTVYNDNGDMTVTRPHPSYDQCCNAYFAEKAINAAIAQVDAALKGE